MVIFENISKKIHEPLYFVFRLLVGFLFLFHGMQKFGWLTFAPMNISGFAGFAHIPVWLAYVVATVEFGGGLLIMLGLFTRLASIFTAINVIGAFIIAHLPKAILPMANGGELAVLYLATFLVIFIYGSGKWSLDKAIFNKDVF